MSRISAKNAVVFGVSADTVESHKGFAEKEKLNFPLLADPGKEMIKAYGVLGGNGYPNRVTFIIGRDGKILSIDNAVNDQFERGATLKTRHADNIDLALSDWHAKVGQALPNFSLPADGGKTVSLFAPRKKATVVFFMGKTCPVSKSYEPRMAEIAADPAFKDVQFMGIAYDNTGAPRNRTASPAAAAGQGMVAKAVAVLDEMDKLIDGMGSGPHASSMPFPVATDAPGEIAAHFQTSVTPAVWVVNAKGVAVYSGAIDDSQDAAAVKKRYLHDALTAVVAGKAVEVAETGVTGCPIRKPR